VTNKRSLRLGPISKLTPIKMAKVYINKMPGLSAVG